ncbi:MAG: recombinase family protein [Candidatus Binatia bacterium]
MVTKPGVGRTIERDERFDRRGLAECGGARLSYDAIAARLNADGVPTRTGKAWVGGAVYGILTRGRLDVSGRRRTDK